MDEQIRSELRQKKISEMKQPIILMNESDFQKFKSYIESNTNIIIGDSLKYDGVPIRINNTVQEGEIVVYDCIFDKFAAKKIII